MHRIEKYSYHYKGLTSLISIIILSTGEFKGDERNEQGFDRLVLYLKYFNQIFNFILHTSCNVISHR